MSDEPSEREPIGEDARIDALDQRLKAAREREDERNRPVVGVVDADANYRMGSRVLSELIGGIGGGALIGWVIDRFAGTSPWGLLVLLFLGTGAAFRSIIRNSSRRSE